MKLRTILFFIVTGTLFLCASSASAVPYALNFDPDGTEAAFAAETIYGWDFEAVAETSLPSGLGPFDTVVYQSLGADNILNDGDSFSESFTVSVENGLGAPPSFSNQGFADYNPSSGASADVYVDLSLSGIISNYDSGTDGVNTNASNAATAIEDDSFNSLYQTGNGTMYNDGDGDLNWDGGTDDNKIAEFSLSDSDPLILLPSVFSGTGAATVGLTLQFDWIDTDNFSQATGFADPQTLVGKDWLFAVNLGSVSAQGIDGDTTTNPDQIAFGFQENGFDSKFSQVPEPTTLLLFGTGLLGLAAFGRKKFSKKS